MTTANVVLVAPNLTALRECREVVNYYAPIKLSDTQFDVLRRDLGYLVEYMAATDQSTNSALGVAVSKLSVSAVQQAVADIEEQVGEDKESSKKELKVLLGKLKKDFEGLQGKIETPRYNLESMEYTGNSGRLQIFQDKVNSLHAATKESDNGEYDVLLADKKVLDEAIKAYQATSFYDQLQLVIAEVDKIAQSSDSPAEFKAKLIKNSVGLVNKLLGVADAEVKYNDMTKARSALAAQLKVFEDRNNDTDKKLKEYFHIIAEIKDFESLRAPKKQYVDEVKKIVDSFDSFISVVFAGSVPEDQAQRFMTHAPAFKSYVESIIGKWLRTN